MPQFFLITFLLLFLISPTSSHLSAYSPPELTTQLTTLHTTNSIPYSIANFGVIPYGKQLTGSVTIANPMPNCEYEQDVSETTNTGKLNKFLMISRGECKFAKKVSNAQMEGYQMAIIVDDVVEKSGRVVMVSDGYTSHISIPSIFIGREDGEVIGNSTNPILTIKFETIITDTADIGLWLSLVDRRSYIFLREFQPYHSKVQSQVKLQTYYYTFQCDEQLCSAQDCFGGFKYCAMDPDGPERPGTGRTVILEQLRALKVFQQDQQKWWEYMSSVDEHCVEYGSLEACSVIQMKKLGIDSDKLLSSVNQTFTSSPNPSSSQNPLLSSQSHSILSQGILFFPDVTINNLTYYGQLQPIDVFQMICNSIVSPPQSCNSFVDDQGKVTPRKQQDTHVVKIAIGASIIVVVFCVFLVCVYRRWVRRKLSREMSGQVVGQLVAQYITLYETRGIQERKMDERI